MIDIATLSRVRDPSRVTRFTFGRLDGLIRSGKPQVEPRSGALHSGYAGAAMPDRSVSNLLSNGLLSSAGRHPSCGIPASNFEACTGLFDRPGCSGRSSGPAAVQHSGAPRSSDTRRRGPKSRACIGYQLCMPAAAARALACAARILRRNSPKAALSRAVTAWKSSSTRVLCQMAPSIRS